MTIDPEKIEPREFYRRMVECITPRPIAWVSTVSPGGAANLAPFSFFNGVGANPPAVMFSPVNRRDGSRKDTVINVEATREFVVNVVPYRLAERMNATSAEWAYEVSEFERCGLTAVASVKVRPPRVAEAPVQMECALHQIVRVGEGPLAANVIIGRIVLMHVSEDVMNAAGEIEADRLDTVGRMGGSLYSRTRERFAMERPDRK
jgi:flavin reductase (DIM6/NTAB) family NADH-FMN oxidoreductase RutF